MPSFIPEHAYGLIPGTYDQYGLVPWPKHLRPRTAAEAAEEGRAAHLREDGYQTAESAPNARREPPLPNGDSLAMPDFVPTIELDAGFLFLTCKENDRLSISTTIERLINMLDDMEPDCDLEPWLGSGDDCESDSADDEPSLGWTTSGHLGSTLPEDDERENVSEDEGAITGDDEYSLGWTEEIDQERRLRVAAGVWQDEDAEPSLGWAESHGRGIVGEQNCIDDREHDNDDLEPEIDGSDLECSGESPAETPGGGSVSQYEDGWRPAPGSGVAPGLKEKARRLPNGVIVREIRPIPPDAIPMLKASDFDRMPWA